MKTKNWKTGLMLLAAVSSFQVAYGQQAGYQANAGAQVLNSEAIDIDGYVTEPMATDAELENVKQELRKQRQTITINKEKSKKYKELTKTTEKLADVTEEMIDERSDAQSEIERYNKKIDCLMNQSNSPDCEEFVKNKKTDEVSVQVAAPQQVIEVEAPAPKKKIDQRIKITPLAGLTAISAETENLESDVSIGLRGEANVSERVSIGMGVHYMSLQTTDFGDDSYYGGYLDGYYDYYNVREIAYSNLNIDIYSKFYIVNGERFRPYVGGGLGYNRSTIKYEDNRSYDPYSQGYMGYNNYNFGNEEVISSHMSAKLLAGSEIAFTDSIGLNVELAYSRGLGSSFNTDEGVNPYRAPDQRRLNDLNDEINNANIFSLNVGMMIVF